jgi:peptide/nickel transport system substrate-binding protein
MAPGPAGLRRGHFRAAVTVFATLSLVVSACGTATPSTSQGAGESAAPGSSGVAATPGVVEPTGELVVAIDNIGTQEFTPYLAYSDNQFVTFTLGDWLTIEEPETGNYVGQLAESFELSDDGTTWTFKLKPNIPFHDGNGTMTAADWKYTWSQYIHPEAGFDATQPMQQAIDNDLDNFEIVNDLEFKLHTTQPIVTLASKLSQAQGGPFLLSKSYYETDPNANNHPIATGPYKFVSSTQGEEVVFEAVPNHWRSTPSYKKLTIKYVPDATARLLGVKSGLYDLAMMNADQTNEANAQGIKIIDVKETGNGYIVLGGSYYGAEQLDEDSPWIQVDAPEKGLAIREALSLAIDRATIRDRLMFGGGALTHCPLFEFPSNPLMIDPSWTLPAYDPELAKQKLAEGGYPDGFPIKMEIFDQKGGPASVATAVADYWTAIGVDVTHDLTSDEAFGPNIDNRETDGVAWEQIRGYAEPAVNIISVQPSREDAKFIDPLWTEAFDKMTLEPDQGKRFEMARELCTQTQKDFRALPLFTNDQPWASGPKVGTWEPIPHFDQGNSYDTVRP